MGKPKGRNGFFHYMLHKQQELKRNGEDLGINDSRLQQLAGDEWKVLSPEDRIPFNNRAKAEKDRPQNNRINIQPQNYQQRQGEHFGRQMAAESNRIDEVGDRAQYLDQLIACSVKACNTKEELLNASFFVMSSNMMIKTNRNEYYPLEIGITQYTIKEGIQFTYHEFIAPGPVPIGYMSQAKDWAAESHKIPFDNFIAASNNYDKIVEDIYQILRESCFVNEISGKPTPMMVYCMEGDENAEIDQNKGVLEWLANKYRIKNPTFEWDLEVLDLVNLLYHVSNFVGRPIGPAFAEDFLTTSAFDYSAETNCGFHEEQDNKNCARGKARRYCYMLSQALCQLMDVTPTANHLPPKRENVVAETYRAELTTPVNLAPAHRYHSSNSTEQTEDWAPNTSRESQAEDPQTSRPPSALPGIGRGRGCWVRR